MATLQEFLKDKYTIINFQFQIVDKNTYAKYCFEDWINNRSQVWIQLELA
jgi:hypothetical protein